MPEEFDGYPPVMDEEEEQRRKPYAAYPPVVPSPHVSDVPAPDLGVPTTAPLSGPSPQPSASIAAANTPQPKWGDYAPPEKHGWGKLGSVLASFQSQANQAVNVAPAQRAKHAYEAATKEHDTQFNEGLKLTQEVRAKDKEETDANLHKKQAEQFDKVPVVVNGQTYYIPQKDAERLIGERVKAEAGQKKEETRGDTARDVADKKAQNVRQPIRVMGNETYEKQQDGSWKVIGPAPPRAEAGNYSPVNDENGATVAWVNPKSGHMVKVGEIQGMGDAAPGGAIPPKPSGQTRSRQDQAAAIDRASTGLIKTLEANKNKVGNVKAILESAFLRTPLADPELSGIATELASYAALQPALHGFRGQDALNEFMKIIGGVPKDADALIASIRAIQKTAGYVNPRIGGEGANKPPAGASDEVLKDGKVIGHVVRGADGKKKFVALPKVQ
jgi:hypothetical protein